MSDDLYLYADELQNHLSGARHAADQIYNLALEPRGPMTDAEKALARAYYRRTAQYIKDAATALEAVKDAIDF